MEARCIDCKLNDRLGYRWKLYFLQDGADEALDDSWKEKTDWEDKTATGLSSSSLVVKPGYLLPGRKYRLQLNAWKPGGEPGGYVIEQLFMNIAPAGGSCQVPITQGFALETEFNVKCEGWKDDDKPLSYLIGNGCHSYKEENSFICVTEHKCYHTRKRMANQHLVLEANKVVSYFILRALTPPPTPI